MAVFINHFNKKDVLWSIAHAWENKTGHFRTLGIIFGHQFCLRMKAQKNLKVSALHMKIQLQKNSCSMLKEWVLKLHAIQECLEIDKNVLVVLQLAGSEVVNMVLHVK